MHRPVAGLVLLMVLVSAGCDAGTVTPAPPPTTPAGPAAAPSPHPSTVASQDASPDAETEEPSPEAAPTPEPDVGHPDADRAVQLATLLARDVGPRPAGTAGDAVARLAVASWLRGAGWEVEEERFALPQGGTSANLVARWEGRGRGEPHVVVGAHLDTVAGSPGGNDNASGIGALITLAEEMADEAAALPVPLVLVAFGAEEYQPSDPRVHHLGSEHYAERAAADVVAMLSLDMIGHGAVTCICWYDVGPSTLADRLAAIAGPTGFRVERRGDISDHGPFARRGIPAAFLWTYREPRFHTPADTWEHLEAAAIARAAALAVEFVRDLHPRDLDGLDPVP